MISLGTTLQQEPVLLPGFHDLSGHILVQGQTRSGKSVCLYTILAQAADDSTIQVAGLDPTGVLLRPWKEQAPDLITTANTPEDDVSAVNAMVKIMGERIDLLGKLQTDKLATNTENPLLLCVFDEYPGTLARAELEDRKINQAIRKGIQRLVLEGAKVGIRCIFAAQKVLAEVVGSEIRSNCIYRISFKVDSAESLKLAHPLITDPNTTAQKLRSRPPGWGLLDSPEKSTTLFRGHFSDYERYKTSVRSGLRMR